MDIHNVREKIGKLVQKVYTVICSTDALNNNVMRIDSSSGQFAINEFKRNIVSAAVILVQVVNKLQQLQGYMQHVILLGSIIESIKEMIRKAERIADLWKSHNEIVDNFEADPKMNFKDFIAMLATSFTDIFNLSVMARMVPYFIHFVSSSSPEDMERSLERAIAHGYMPIPLNESSRSVNLLNLVSSKVAIDVYRCLAKTVDAFSAVLLIHFNAIDHVINCSSILEENPQSTFIKKAAQTLSVDGKGIDYRFVVMCIMQTSLIKYYLPLYKAFDNAIININELGNNACSLFTPEQIEWLEIL